MRAPALKVTTLPLPTRHGIFVARYSGHGLASLEFPGDDVTGDGATGSVREWHALTTACVSAVLSGEDLTDLPPLDLTGQTPFRVRVWRQLQKIRVGETLSYGEVARAMGQPLAVRAVGSACGANPIPLLIPCHRVVQMAGGRRTLGGFSGGLGWKRTLLATEGVCLDRQDGQQQASFSRFDTLFLSGSRL